MDILTLIKPTNIQKGTTTKTVWGQGTDTWCVPWGNQAGNRENNVGGAMDYPPWNKATEFNPAEAETGCLEDEISFWGFGLWLSVFQGKLRAVVWGSFQRNSKIILAEFWSHLQIIQIPSLKLTVHTWKWMFWKMKSPFGSPRPIFREALAEIRWLRRPKTST